MALSTLERAIDGDKKDIESLILKNSEYIYKLAFLHTKYEEDSFVIMNRVIDYIKQNIGKLSKYHSFEQYVLEITIRHINEYLESVGIVEQGDIYDCIDENDYINMFKSIDFLDIHSKNVVIMFYYYELSYEVIGKILNMKESTVELYLRNSLKSIVVKIREDLIDNENDTKINLGNFDIKNDIQKYEKYYCIDKSYFNSIDIPNNLDKSVKSYLNIPKKEKRKDIIYKIIDITLVCIILSPIAGVIQPKIFEKSPNMYKIFQNVNELIQIDNLKSLMGIETKEVIEGKDSANIETEYISEEDVKMPNGNNDAIKLIHSLANTLIEAKYKWQCSEVTPKTIDLAIEGVEKIKDSYDRMHLRNSLTKWRDGDFSNAVEVHNYVWELQDGNIGKATDLDHEEIKNIVDKYYKEGE